MNDIQDQQTIYINDSIESIDLPAQICLCLKRQGFSTIQDLTDLSESDLLGILNINEITDLPVDSIAKKAELNDRLTAIDQVRRKLAEYGLSLYCDLGGKRTPNNSIKNVAAKRSFQNKLSLPINGIPISVRAQNCLQAERIYCLGDLVQFSEIEILKIPNLGKKTFREIQSYLNKIDLSLNMKIDIWPIVESTNENYSLIKQTEHPSVSDIFYGLNTIEEQLNKILEISCKKKSDKQITRLRLGWSGLSIPTLEKISEDILLSGLNHTVTRERIRQIECKVKQKIKRRMSMAPQPPALLRAIQILKEHSLVYEDELFRLLHSADLTKINMGYDVLRGAAEITGCGWPFVLLKFSEQSERIILYEDNSERIKETKYLIQSLNETIRGRTFLTLSEFEGAISNISSEQKEFLKKIITYSPNYHWLNHEKNVFWKPPNNKIGKGNRVLHICRKIFSVAEECSIEDLCIAISRNLKHGSYTTQQAEINTPSKLLLTEMLRQTKLFDIKSGKVTKVPGVEFDDLSLTDIKLLRAAKGMGPIVRFTDICHNAVKEGLSLISSQVAISTLNPFFCRMSIGYYRVLVDPDKIDLDNQHQNEDEYCQENRPLEELFFEISPRVIVLGKATLSKPASIDQEWDVYSTENRKIGRCKTHGEEISQIKDILKELDAVSGDLVQIILNEAERSAHFHLITEHNEKR